MFPDNYPYDAVVPVSTVLEYTGSTWRIIGNMKTAPLAHRTFMSNNMVYHVTYNRVFIIVYSLLLIHFYIHRLSNVIKIAV